MSSPERVELVGPALPITCPACGTKVSWDRAAPNVQFLCPGCGHGLRLRAAYFRVANIMSVLVAGLLAYALGARREVLFWVVCLGWLPTTFILTNVSVRLFPVDVEVTGEFRGILYANDRETPGEGGADTARRAHDNDSRTDI